MQFEHWIEALQQRHLADLRIPEVTRALRALSSAYVERRHTVVRGGPLDSAGKRAAFALFYSPLHFLTVTHVVAALTAGQRQPKSILDVGCGTGAAGAAWALAAAGKPMMSGIDRHPWAVDETRWTYRTLGLHGTARRGDAGRLPAAGPGSAIIAAYTMNELEADLRTRVEAQLFAAARRGIDILILEPIARGIAPWWDDAARRARAEGGRADEWRFAVDLPPLLGTLDKAAGLDHRELTARTIWLAGTR